MKSLAIVAMAALLLMLFFQCCPSAPAEPPPAQAPPEQSPARPGEPSPEETAAPTPLPPSPTSAPQPVVLEFTGYGDEATQLFRLDAGLIRCSYTHDGERNFIVELLDGQGHYEALMANEIGACEGSSADSIRSSDEYLLTVKGDGNWNFRCEASAPADQPPARQLTAVAEFSGYGDEATEFFHLESGLARCDYTHDGQRNFIVELLDEQGNFVALMANEIGACEGSTATGVDPAGDYLLDIKGDGNWTITLSQ